jgi:transposase-like protein
MADWQKIRAEYITTDISYRKLAEKYGLDQATIARKAKKEDWVSKRQHHADKTQAKILTADTQKKVDRVGRLMTVADKLLKKVELAVDQEGPISAGAIKNLSDALKNIRETQMIRSEQDIREQEARIAKLQKEAQREDIQKEPIRVIIDDGLSEYSK